MKFIGLDGDSIGRIIELYLIKNQIVELRLFSEKIVLALEEIKHQAIDRGAEVIFCTGDSILVYGDFESNFENKILNIFYEITGKTASVGIGKSLAEAYLGLKLAKANGGNQAVSYQIG